MTSVQQLLALNLGSATIKAAPVLLTQEVITALSAYADMDPLHQAAALQLVAASRVRWTDAKSATAHSVKPSRRRDSALRIPRTGVPVGNAQVQRLDKSAGQEPIVLAHLGGGSSLCAVNKGRSVDTTMGLTPLDGLPMATALRGFDALILTGMTAVASALAYR